MIVFPRQKWLGEHILMLRYRSIACHVNIVTEYVLESIYLLHGIRGLCRSPLL